VRYTEINIGERKRERNIGEREREGVTIRYQKNIFEVVYEA
jgi:hypothetical protein